MRKKYFKLLKVGISHDASIFCNNCFGARISTDLGYQYNSPMAGLKLAQEDYHVLLENILYINESEIKPRDKSKYGVNSYNAGHLTGYIELNGHDIELYLVHYKSIEEANQKWRRRCQRINFNNLILIETDTDYTSQTTEDDINRFFDLPYKKKIYLCTNPLGDIEQQNYFFVKEREGNVLMPYQEAHILYRYLVKADWFNHS